MGCAACYEVFGTEVKTMLSDMQNGTKHVGKVPATHVAAAKSAEKLKISNWSLKKRWRKRISKGRPVFATR